MDDHLIVSSFPIVFANGHTVSELRFWCTKCGRTADTDAVVGEVSRLTTAVADIWASYRCPCGHCEQYRIRLRDDKSCIYMAHGRWVKTSRRRLGIRGFLHLWAVASYRFCRITWSNFKLRRKLKQFKKAFMQ